MYILRKHVNYKNKINILNKKELMLTSDIRVIFSLRNYILNNIQRFYKQFFKNFFNKIF